jgi:hypothetical protein
MTEWNYDVTKLPQEEKFLGLWAEDEVHLVMFYDALGDGNKELVIAEGGLEGIETPLAWAPLPDQKLTTVIARAKEIVSQPKTQFGYGDIGDAIVAYLRGDKTEAEAIETLNNLQLDYDRARAR